MSREGASFCSSCGISGAARRSAIGAMSATPYGSGVRLPYAPAPRVCADGTANISSGSTRSLFGAMSRSSTFAGSAPGAPGVCFGGDGRMVGRACFIAAVSSRTDALGGCALRAFAASRASVRMAGSVVSFRSTSGFVSARGLAPASAACGRRGGGAAPTPRSAFTNSWSDSPTALPSDHSLARVSRMIVASDVLPAAARRMSSTPRLSASGDMMRAAFGGGVVFSAGCMETATGAAGSLGAGALSPFARRTSSAKVRIFRTSGVSVSPSAIHSSIAQRAAS